MSEIKEGTYRARAREWEFGQSKTGTPYVAVRFELVDLGEYITWYGYLTERTQDRTMESLRHCGWDNDDITRPTGLNEIEVELVVERETYEGKTRAKVQWVNRIGGRALKVDEVDERTRRTFAAQMKAAAVASRKGMPVKPPKPAEPPPISDDDTPF